MSKSELYELLAYLDLEQYEKVVPEIEKKDQEIERLNNELEQQNIDYGLEIERLNNIINELEKEIDRLLERQYESERFAKEQGFCTYLPAKENLLYVKNRLQELKGSDKE